MINKIKSKYRERVNNIFKKKPDFEAMFNDERKVALTWEHKYNKLYRQLGAILKESDS
jgi:hypothetical protein